MAQHTALAAEFAAHFGNTQFEPVAPREQMLYVIAHHDAGWEAFDSQALRDPATGLPYNLVQTPFEYIVATSQASPDFNSATHPYCGLISSMHSWGLYNGRYGMSDKMLLDSLAAENREVADGMLAGELQRQEQLKTRLRSDPDTAAWVEEAPLFQNYKQLQFCDALALYFNCTSADARERSTYTHVPMSANADTDVTIEPVTNTRYALNPYPFDRDNIELSFAGRYLSPVASGDKLRAEFVRTEITQQSFVLTANGMHA